MNWYGYLLYYIVLFLIQAECLKIQKKVQHASDFNLSNFIYTINYKRGQAKQQKGDLKKMYTFLIWLPRRAAFCQGIGKTGWIM